MAVDSEHAVAILTEIFENGVKSDLITLVAGVGGLRVPIHRNILTANSKYFTASLGSNFVEADENEFILDETDGPMLKAIVDFCYTGRIGLTMENVTKYLEIASGVELHLLEPKCWRILTDGLSVNNAAKTLMIADKYSCHELRQKALNLVCAIFDKLPSTQIDGFDNRMWEEILKRDDVRGEEQFILERLLDWFRNDEDERGQHMTELLKLIRLPLIPPQYLDGDTIQIIYTLFDCSEHLIAEKGRRIAYPTRNSETRRHMSIFCLFQQVEQGTFKKEVKIERYIRASNEFERVGEIDLGERNSYGAILHRHNVYILGGMLDGVVTNSVSVYELSSGRKRDLPEMNSARSDFATLLLGKFIHVFGGNNAYHREMRSCERFNLETETWEELSPMNTARYGASAVELNGYIYVGCGLYRRKESEMFDPRNNTWNTLPLLNDYQRTLFSLRNGLYATGESWSRERYDSRESRWTKIKSMGMSIDVASTVVQYDKTYFIGRHGFGELKIDENGVSFVLFGTSMLDGRYQLCLN